MPSGCVCGLLVCLRMCVTYTCAVYTTTYKYMPLRPITGCEQTHSCPQTRLIYPDSWSFQTIWKL